MSITVKREQCATCRYLDVDPNDPEEGWCVRRPPVVMMSADGKELVTNFPEIYDTKTTWCGEWEDAS